MESRKDSVREETCSFRHDADERAKPTPETAQSSEPPTKRSWSVSRKRIWECGVHLGGSLDSCAKTTWKVFAPNHLVIIGILPKVNSTHQNRDVNSVIRAHLHTGRLKVNLAKKRKRMVTNVQWPYRKLHDGWVAYLRTQSRQNLFRFYGRAQKSWDQFDECDPQKLRSVMQTSEKKVRRSEKFKSNFISAACGLWNLRINLRRRLKGAMCSRRRVETGQERRKDQRKGQSYLPVTNERMVSPSAIRNKTGGNRICCRFRSINAHNDQERLELCRIPSPTTVVTANGEVQTTEEATVYVKKGTYSWQSSFSKIFRPFSHPENSAEITDILTSGPVARNHNLSKMAEKGKVQRGKLRTTRCPWFIDELFKHSYTYISNISIAGSSSSYIASRINKKWEYE